MPHSNPARPGIDVDKVMKRVKSAIEKKTGKPWKESDKIGKEGLAIIRAELAKQIRIVYAVHPPVSVVHVEIEIQR
jgi:DNA polymerase elongation subunit (family B)